MLTLGYTKPGLTPLNQPVISTSGGPDAPLIRNSLISYVAPAVSGGYPAPATQLTWFAAAVDAGGLSPPSSSTPPPAATTPTATAVTVSTGGSSPLPPPVAVGPTAPETTPSATTPSAVVTAPAAPTSRRWLPWALGAAAVAAIGVMIFRR